MHLRIDEDVQRHTTTFHHVREDDEKETMIVPTGERPVPPPKLQEIDDLLIRTVQEKRIVEENERLRRQVPFRCHLRERSHDIDVVVVVVVVVGRCSSSTSGRSRPCRRRSGTWRSANISPSSSAGRRATRPTSTRPTGTCRSASIRPSTSRARPARATGTPIPSFRPTGRSVAVPFLFFLSVLFFFLVFFRQFFNEKKQQKGTHHHRARTGNGFYGSKFH